MKFKIQLMIIDDNNQPLNTEEITLLDKENEVLEDIGINLSESKMVLKNLQEKIVNYQIQTYLTNHCNCSECQKLLKKKSYTILHYQTLFGNLKIKSPRLHYCQCQSHSSKTFSPLKYLFTEHLAPERLYLEAKWASLLSFDKTTNLFQDVFPIHETINASSIKNHLTKVSERIENELGEEKYTFIEGGIREWDKLPLAEEKICVGLDGGYLRNWNDKKTHFEVIAGKSVPEDTQAKFFGFVDTYQPSKPKRILFETLKSQGFQIRQPIEFFSDGAKNLRDLQTYLSPDAEYYLDWFHITMKITVLQQFIKGIYKVDRKNGSRFKKYFEGIKWSLWNGNVTKALEKLDDLCFEIEECEIEYSGFKKFKNLFKEFFTYIEQNDDYIPNYAERRRYDEVISTSFVESTINQVVSKRFCKKQQMQWTKKGAHVMLLARTKVLNHELDDQFRKWYPKFGIHEKPIKIAA